MWSLRAFALFCLALGACVYDWSNLSSGTNTSDPDAAAGFDAGGNANQTDGGDTAAPEGGDGKTCELSACGPNASACLVQGGGPKCVCAGLWSGERCTQQQPLMIGPTSVAASENGAFAVVVLANNQYVSPVVLRVDLRSGERSVLSGFDPQTGSIRGSGRLLERVQSVVLDEARSRALLLDVAELALVSIDLDTGERKRLSDADDGGSALGEGPGFVAPEDLVLDLVRGRVLVADQGLKAIVAVDLATGKRSIFSTADRGGVAIGAGPAMPLLRSIDIDAGRDRAIVSSAQDLLVVDLTSGQRSLLSDGSQAPAVGLLRSVAVHESANQVLALDTSQRAVFSVNLVTGERSVLSLADPTQPTPGSGPTFTYAVDIALDAAGKRLLVADQDADLVSTVSLLDGARAILGDHTLGSGPGLVYPGRLIEDSRAARWLVSDGYDAGRILSIEMGLRSRSILSGTDLDGKAIGTGPLLRRPVGLALDREASRLLVYDTLLGAIVAIDLGSGNRSILSSASHAGVAVGEGPSLTNQQGGGGLVLDRARGRLLATGENGRLLAIDLASGDRSEWQQQALSGLDLVLSAVGDKAYLTGADVFGEAFGLVEIDLATGVARVASGAPSAGAPVTGEGPGFKYTTGVTLSTDGQRAFVVGDAGVYAVELATGDRVLLSGLSVEREVVGAGAFALFGSLIFDGPGKRLLALDTYTRALCEVDLDTGQRWLLSLGRPDRPQPNRF